ncbi:uncharacterized protein [Amphiura filiformis]|uniref:uncharacterized protein n=1 Tax=Amphiura filiformis TaxID=82378 RepID=UPI003B21B337
MLAKEKDNLDELVVELNTCKRKICLSEDKGTHLQKHCKQLAKDITDTMNEDFEIQQLTRAEKEIYTENQRLYERYRSKMAHHGQGVTEVEADMGVNVEVKKQQELIAVLQAEKTAIECKLKEDTSHNRRLQQGIKVLSAEKKALNTQNTNIETKIRHECDKHTAINQDIEVLHKRNQAQMTRLKKQIKEGHLRNRQWNVEACQLERHLEELRKSMEE